MTKNGLFKDERDTVQRRVRHRDGRLLRGGIGLVLGAGELVRGTMISAVDQATDLVARRERDAVRTRNNTGMSGTEVAYAGMKEFRNGIDMLNGREPTRWLAFFAPPN